METLTISYSHLIMNNDPRVELIEKNYRTKDAEIILGNDKKLQLIKDGLYGHLYDEGVVLCVEKEHIADLNMFYSYLPEVSFKETLFETCNFKRTYLKGALFEKCTFTGCTFNACYTEGVKFINCTFIGTDIINTDENITFLDCVFVENTKESDVAQ